MNYYEELAVAQDASLEEIHQAYRALARLLHPDSQSDPKLKSAAERQMMRLNEVLATLADPDKRRKYDESLCTKLAVPEAAPPPPLAPSLPLRRQLPWILACCILVGAGLWYLRSNESGDPSADRGPTPSPARSVQPAQTAAPESTPPASENRAPLTEDRLLKRSLARPKPSPPPAYLNPGENSAPGEPVNRLPEPSGPVAAIPSAAAKTAALPVQPPQAIPETPAPAQRAVPQPAPPAFAGHWFYALGSHDVQTPGMYPPEFIEFFLSEEQGVLSGKYWARYRIPDKPVSPEVQFRVNGASQRGDVTTLKWVSDDGANGQMKMVLRGSNSMEVTWWTTAFGRQTALTSGTAVLVRQQVR
jgi:curved DNA-binding protein CbpA